LSRPTKTEYYLNLARQASSRSACSRRKFGAIIVKDDVLISTGYNGSARGTLNCGIDITCLKDVTGEKALVSYDHCPAIHAEQNAILQADPRYRQGATMYLASATTKDGDRPCHLCRRYIIQGNLKDIYYLNKLGQITHEDIADWIKMENEWMENVRDGKS
jgi:dCMP deaminase